MAYNRAEAHFSSERDTNNRDYGLGGCGVVAVGVGCLMVPLTVSFYATIFCGLIIYKVAKPIVKPIVKIVKSCKKSRN